MVIPIQDAHVLEKSLKAFQMRIVQNQGLTRWPWSGRKGDRSERGAVTVPHQAMAALLVMLGACAPVLAQTVPNAGSIRQQIESARELPGVKTAPPAASEPRTSSSTRKGLRIQVERFVVAGNTLLSDAVLDQALAGFVNKNLDFDQLQAATTAVKALYKKEGWRVLVYLPRQEVEQGAITIQVVESRMGQISFEGAPSKRVRKANIQKILEAQQKSGAPLNQDRLDRGLLIASQLSGVTVNSAMKEGELAQTTDVVLQLTDKPQFAGDISTDNSGATTTGQYRISANVELRSLAGLGDLLSASVSHTAGSDYGRVAYSVPVGDDGWRVGANVSRLQYQLISADLAALQAVGHSNSAGLEASYPWVLTPQSQLNLTFSADAKAFYNQANSVVNTRYAANNVTLGLNGSSVDDFGGGGTNFAALNWVSGRVNLNGSPHQTSDAATTRTDGAFSKVRLNASRQQTLTPQLAMYTSYLGQVASKNLDSSEKMYLGGVNGVRAYPSNEAGGSVGQLVNLELRAYLPHSVMLAGFYDWGQVHVNLENNYLGAVVRNQLTLKGAGLGLAWQSTSGLTLKATWARRIGENPYPTLAGKDQDGTLQVNRFWLTASASF